MKIKLINNFIQFFFIRICYMRIEECYGIILPVIPFTGWSNDYVPKKKWIFMLKLFKSYKASEHV